MISGAPAWTIWLWIPTVAVVVMGLAEPPKRLLLRPLWGRSEARKRGIMGLLLLPLGVLIGAPVYLAAGLADDAVLAAVLGAATGAVASPLYDAVLLVIGRLARLVGRGRRDA